MNARRVLPNFLFIGPDKCGSTWMYEVLRGHPEAFVPKVKDIYYFDRYYSRGLDWYASFFRDAPADVRAVGELSHDYLFSTAALRRIRRDLPGVRLFTSLRNPVERSFSQYLYMRRSGMTGSSFEQALAEFPEIIDNSQYYKHLIPYLNEFGPDRVAVLVFDDLVADARAFAERMFAFLGLDTTIELDFESRILPASRARSQRLARLAKLGANWARRLGFPGLVGGVKGSALTRILYAPYETERKPALMPETRRKLVDVFRSDIEQLQELVGRNFGDWMDGGSA